jgi:hypothetical protein
MDRYRLSHGFYSNPKVKGSMLKTGRFKSPLFPTRPRETRERSGLFLLCVGEIMKGTVVSGLFQGNNA